MKAINLFAGIGTMTRAFLAQGAEVIWAQEEIESAAEVYQYNFPEISFFEGALENGIEQIPEHDLLLASIRCVPFLVSSSSAAKYSRGEKEFEEKRRAEKHLELLRKVVEDHRPMDWKATMKLSIYCKNIKTDGLIPESIRLRLLDRS